MVFGEMGVASEKFERSRNFPLSLRIKDFRFWHDNKEKICEWLNDNTCRDSTAETIRDIIERGWIITFESEEVLAWFVMRWG